MTAADALVCYRNSYWLNTKSAGWQEILNGATSFAQKQPAIAGALGGAAVGGLTGLLPGQKILRNALIGAGLGGAGGLGYQMLKDRSGPEAPVQPEADAVKADLQQMEQPSTLQALGLKEEPKKLPTISPAESILKKLQLEHDAATVRP